MNNNKEGAPRRPAPQNRQGSERPRQAPQNRQVGQRPNASPRPTDRRPASPTVRPASPSVAYQRQRKKRISTEALSLIFVILSMIMVALIVILVSLKSDGCSSPDIPAAESSSQPSVEAGATEPEGSSSPSSTPNTPDVPPSPPESDSFLPVSDSSTVDLAANEIYSDYIMMVDLKTGKVVCQHNPDATIYPASMTKIMTAIVAIDLIEDMNDTFTLTAEIVNPLVSEGAAMAGFKVGEPITMTDLIYGTLLPSGADATAALAIALCGSEEEFVNQMNKKAAEIGCTKTNFTNASGLHDKNHYSTVREMAAIMSYAMKNEFLRDVMSTETYTSAAPLNSGTVLKSTWKGYQGSYVSDKATMVAAKTGWTPEAGNCLASLSVTEDGGEFIVISAKATTTDQISGKHQAFSDAAKLCDKYIK